MPDDNELQLRENVFQDTSNRFDSAFVVGGEQYGRDGWIGGHIVCHFGCDNDEDCDCIPGGPPCDKDTRRIEVAWNCHAELVEACRAAQQVFGELLGIPGTPAQHTARDLIDAILTKAQEGQVARGGAGDAEGEG